MLQTVQSTSTPTTKPAAIAERTTSIRQLNDDFRRGGGNVMPPHGRKMMTRGVKALGSAHTVAIALKVMTFNTFTEANDPHGEHDFGAFDHDGRKIFWKIDYYDRGCENGSPDPADPSVTCRVLTVMLADEY